METEIMVWILSALLFGGGLFFVVANYAVIYLALFKRRHSSPVGLIGGILCALALVLCPAKAVGTWFWLPLVLDPGCLFLLCQLFYVILFGNALEK